MEEKGISKLWIVKDFVSYGDDTVCETEPEKYLLREWEPQDTATPSRIKESLGLVYEHEGSLAGNFSLPILRHDQVNGLVKKLLTFIDATIGDGEQKEATKKLVTRLVWDHYNEITQNVSRTLSYADEVKELN